MRRPILVLLLLLLPFHHAAAQDFWQPTSGPTGGEFLALVAAPNEDLFAASFEGGVFRSRDGGDHWTRVRARSEGTYALAVDHEGCVYVAATSGLHASCDGGGTWTELNRDVVALSLAVDSAGDLFVVDVVTGLLRSTDRGASWVALDRGSEMTSALLIDSADRIFAGTNTGSLYLSVDTGDHWSHLQSPFIGGILVLGVGKDGGLYAGGYGGGVLRSNDLGETWTALGPRNAAVLAVTAEADGQVLAGTAGAGLQRGRQAGAFFDWYPVDLGVRARTVEALVDDARGRLFAGAQGPGILRSDDRGDHWTVVDQGLTGVQLSELFFDRENRIFAASGLTGVLRSSDDGATWDHLPLDEPTSFALDADGNLLCGTSNGVYRSYDHGDIWVPLGPEWHAVNAITVLGSGAILVGTAWTGVFVSTNGGRTWSESSNGLGHLDVHALAVTPDGDVLAGTFSGLYSSADGGAHWSPRGLDNLWVYDLNVDSHGVVYAATTAGPYLSNATRDQWTPLAGLPPATGVRDIAVDAFDQPWLATTTGVTCSRDGGASWQNHSTGLADPNVLVLGIDSRGFLYAQGWGGAVYRSTQASTPVALSDVSAETEASAVLLRWRAAFDDGEVARFRVYRQSDGEEFPGGGFEPLAPDIPSGSSGDYAFRDGEPTPGRSLYRIAALSTSGSMVASRDVEVRWQETPRRSRVVTSFPNPFTPRTTVRLDVEGGGPADIAVYDARGRLLRRLWSDAAPRPGLRDAVWDGCDSTGRPVGSGTYWVRLVVGGRIAGTRALTVVR